MSICYYARHYAGESGNLGDGTFADPFRPVTNPGITNWLAATEPGSVLCAVDAVFGASGPLYLDPADIRAAVVPGRPLILSGDPARWGDAPATTVRSQRYGYKALSPSWAQVGSTGVYAATLPQLRAQAGLAYNIDARSDRAGTAVRDAFFERPTLVFHPQDCWAVPHTCCRSRRATAGAVVAGNTFSIAYPSSSTLTLTARDATPTTLNSPDMREFVRDADPAVTAANLAAVINRALPLTLQVNDAFTGNVRAGWWTGGAGTISDEVLTIADAGQGVWKTGQSQPVAHLRFRLTVTAISATDGNALRIEIARNAATGETFGLWLSRVGADLKIGANTSDVTAAADATLALAIANVIETCFDADRGVWWLWLNGVEIASGVAGPGPVIVTDVGLKAYAGTGPATDWAMTVKYLRVSFEDQAKPNLRHISAWANGADVYVPQLYTDTVTITASSTFTVTADVWLVHLTGEADPASKSWYGADSNGNNIVDIIPRSSEERCSDIVVADLDIVATAYLDNGLHGSYSQNNSYPYQRLWAYRTSIIRPGYIPEYRCHNLVLDRVTFWDCPETGPYFEMLSASPAYDPPELMHSKGYLDNITVGAHLHHIRVFGAGCLWNAATLCSPNLDAHSLAFQSARDVIVDDYQAAACADAAIWFGGTANRAPSLHGATHRPDIGGEDRAFWVAEGRANQRLTGSLRNYWSEDQHRRINGNERATRGKYGLNVANNPNPVDIDIYGMMIRGWPFGAPMQALRLYPAVAAETPGDYGIRVRGLAALYTSGIKIGGESEPSLWPLHFFDTARPDQPATPPRAGIEQRRRPGASWLGFLEGTDGESATGLAVAFTPGAAIGQADLLATGALSLWLRKTGSPGNITVAIGTGASPDVAAASPLYTATVTAASISTAAGGASLAVTLTGAGELAAGVKHWLILTVAAASTSAYYQWFGWWGGRYASFPSADYRASLSPAWAAEADDFSPWFTLATLGHAPATDFADHVFNLGSATTGEQKLAQRFRTGAAPLSLAGIGVWLARHGSANGATNLPVAIHADAGGEPGAIVVPCLPIADTQGRQPSWTTHQAGCGQYAIPPIGTQLAANTDYWLVFDAPQIDATHYYRLFGCIDGAADGYGAKAWDGATWDWADPAEDRAKLYFTLWAAPAGAAQLPAWPQVSVDDVLVVSPRPARNAFGGWDALAAGDRKVANGAVFGAAAAFLYCGHAGNSKTGGSSFDAWVLTGDFDPARPVVRGLLAIGTAPVFDEGQRYPAADVWAGAGGSSGFFRYGNFELAANLGATELHHGQLTATQWVERSRAAGQAFGRDLMAITGA